MVELAPPAFNTGTVSFGLEPSAYAWPRRRRVPLLCVLFVLELALKSLLTSAPLLLAGLLIYSSAREPSSPALELGGLPSCLRALWRYGLVPIVCLLLAIYGVLMLLGCSDGFQRFLVFGAQQG